MENKQVEVIREQLECVQGIFERLCALEKLGFRISNVEINKWQARRFELQKDIKYHEAQPTLF